MKKHLIIAASLLTLFAASCSNEDIIENENPEVIAGKTITLNATINNGTDTRLAYTDEDGKAMSVAWTAGDSFMMYRGKKDTGTTFTNTTEKPSSFTGETPAGEEGSYYAVYGNNITNSDGTLTLDLSQPQMGDASVKDGITEMMLATTDVLDESTSLSFNHLLTVLKLNLEFPKGVSGTTSKVTVMGFHNKATYTLADGKYAYEATDMGDITATNDSKGFTIGDDHKITAYVAVFPEKVFECNATIKVEVGADTYLYTIQATKELTVGKVVPVGVKMIKLEYVDLGLSVMWANMNVGANTPEQPGGYYAWGETVNKENCSWKTYICTSEDDCGTDKDPLQAYVKPNNQSIAGTDYDVAHVKWGGKWKMPTVEQLKELKDDCVWQWVEASKYYKVMNKSDHNKFIILPAAGFRNGSLLDYEGFDGYYRSATPHSNSAYLANSLAFYSGYVYWYGNYRCYGQSVRPVSE